MKLDIFTKSRIFNFPVAAIIAFSCSFRIARGEKYNPMLKLNTSMVFREKERKFKNIVSIGIFCI